MSQVNVLIVGYGLATVLYGGFTLYLQARRRALQTALAQVRTDDQER
jgi:hypothetical protein